MRKGAWLNSYPVWHVSIMLLLSFMLCCLNSWGTPLNEFCLMWYGELCVGEFETGKKKKTPLVCVPDNPFYLETHIVNFCDVLLIKYNPVSSTPFLWFLFWISYTVGLLDFSYMFSYCSHFTSLYFSNFEEEVDIVIFHFFC